MNRCPRVFLYTYDAMMLFYLSAGGTIKVSPVISLDREWRSASLPCSPMDMLVALQLHTRVLFDAKSTGAEGITVPWGEVMEEYFDKVVGEVSGVLSHTAKLATDEESSRPVSRVNKESN